MRNLLRLSENEADNDSFPWDMQIIGDAIDAIKDVLASHGYPGTCHPYYVSGVDSDVPCYQSGDCSCQGCPFKGNRKEATQESKVVAEDSDPIVYVFNIDQDVTGTLRVPARGRSEDEVFVDVLKDLKKVVDLNDLPGFTPDEEFEIEVNLEAVEELEPDSAATPCNTRVHYLYRDAENNKVQNAYVVKGIVTENQQAAILDSLNKGEFFIPEKVGLDGERFGDFDPEIDHPWFELDEDSFEATNDKPDTEMTAEELVEQFVACKDCWED